MRDRLARRLVRLYPRAWRARYEDELVAMLDARDDVGWDDALDIGLGVAREWTRWLAAWPTRGPASTLRELHREAHLELLILSIAAVLINLAARGMAFEIRPFATPDLPGFAAVIWIQTAAAFRVTLTRLWWRTERNDAIDARELAAWCVAIFSAAILAHIDLGRTHFAALPTASWWERFPVTPAFSIWLALLFLTQGTPAARARVRRMRELEAIRRVRDVPSSPLGLKS